MYRYRPRYLKFIILALFVYKTPANEDVNQTTTTTSERSFILESDVPVKDGRLFPTVMIHFAARNKAHVLPYFLSLLTSLDYPKNRISLWICSDHNGDKTIDVIQMWLSKVENDYHSVNFTSELKSLQFPNELSITDWSVERFEHIIKLKEEALKASKKMWADYIWVGIKDFNMINPFAAGLHNILICIPCWLYSLLAITVIAPMLNTFRTYSNFWCGMDENYYYQRTSEYLPIQSRESIGVHRVVLVQAAILIDLRIKSSHDLSFDPHKLANTSCPYDDIIAFSVSAKSLGIELFVSNENKFGYMPVPLDKEEGIQVEIDRITDFKLDVIAMSSQKQKVPENGDVSRKTARYSAQQVADILDYDDEETVGFDEDYPSNELETDSVDNDNDSETKNKPIEVLPYLESYLPLNNKDNMNFDQMYMINLERRSDRRKNMMAAFREIGFEVKVIEAVDGKKLNFSSLEQQITQLPGYLDPYNDREMKLGEIGCFLSHYKIWQEIVKNKYKRVIIFEDDVKFHEAFRKNFKIAIDEADGIDKNWELLYLGRKIMRSGENYMPGASKLVNISYSHWTIAYALTYSGAKKLLDEDPLAKLVPADEYLPIMYNRHPRLEWMSQFEKRDLKAYGIYPTLVEPTHYIGDPGYITDTENSDITYFNKGDSSQIKDEL
ncbi:Procollagen galactosyltransferase 2 [Nymphon striatum]|nr:Procollagen galactosyltransferase 2 [Nymphon striatum]